MPEVKLEYELDPDFVNRHGKKRDITIHLIFSPDDALLMQQNEQRSCDLLLLLDNSGSMSDPFGSDHLNLSKLNGIKTAARSVLPALGANDTLSVISYNTNATILLDQGRGDDQQRIFDIIEGIPQTNGATNFEDALNKATRCLDGCRNQIKRLLFLTDGMNQGGDIERTIQLNRALGQRGIMVDCMGVGRQFDLDFLHHLAADGGGQSAYLETPEEAAGRFQATFDTAKKTLVSNARLLITFPAGSEEIEVFALYPQPHYHTPERQNGPDGTIIYDLPPFAINASHEFILRTRVQPNPDSHVANQVLCTAKLTYDIPSLNLTRQCLEVPVPLHLTDGRTAEQRDTDVERYFYEAYLMKHQTDMNEAFYKKDWDRVANLLRTMVQTAEKLHLPEKLAEYKQKINQLKNQGSLTQEQLNKVYKTSSTVQGSVTTNMAKPSAF